MVERSAQSVVLELLSAMPTGLPVSALVDGCALMGASENAVRVALSRLKRRELITSAERGFYRLGPAAQVVQSVVSGWRTVEERIEDWDGRWIAVHCAAVPKSDRKASRNRARALRLFGFRELSRDLCVRPNNLRAGLDATRARLHELGLDPRDLVFMLSDLDDAAHDEAMRLWDRQALESRYRALTAQLALAEQRLADVAPRQAAREAFLLGSEAIRHIVQDPLLPEPIVDPWLRAELVAAMRRFDAFGRELWRRALVTEEAAVA